MKKINLFLLLFCLFFIGQISGQVRNIHDGLRINRHLSFFTGMKMINDTLWPASFSGTCLDSLRLYYPDAVAPHDSGWVCGSNAWLDKEKAMKFYHGSTTVNSVIPFFGIRRGTNGTIYAKIYAQDATSKGPGVLLGTSSGIAMSAIDTSNQGINWRNVFRFTPAISVTDTFFVSLTMPAFVNGSNEIALFSESISCSRAYRNNAWEQWSDNTWHSFSAANTYNTNIDMAIFPVISVPSTQNHILTFYLSQQTSPATINSSLHQVFVQVAYGTNITSLSPTITVSPNATINPLSNTVQNFTNPFTYNVTAESGSVQPWVVNVSVAAPLSPANDILTFTLSQLTAPAVINTTAHTVTGQVAHGTSRTSLTPTITVSPLATINPASGTAHDFTNPFAYTVTAQDGTPQNWIVTITESAALRGGKNILSFTLPQQQSPANIDTNSHYVSITVLYGTNPSSLTPTITVSPGATINPASGVAVNFTNPYAYTVTAENGNTQPWVVNVSVATQLSPENDILTFTLSQLTAPAVINSTNHTVTGQVAYGTNRTNLTPTVTVSPLATINPASGTAHDFTNPFGYIVTAQDGTPQNWIVTLTEAPPLRGGKNIISFTLPQQQTPANIDTNTHYVSITVVYGTNPSSLTPTITVSPGATINPASGVAVNFSNPYAYTVTAENGNTQPWVVNVSVATLPSSQNDILTFTIPQLTYPAVIDNVSHTVTGQVIHGTGLTNLVPTITVSTMATISPASGMAQNYTNPVAYTVTAQDGTPQNWIVTITEATSFRSGKNILSFTLPQQESPANIDTNTHYVTISVVLGTDRSNLTPTITVSPGASINPVSGTSHSFINPYAYTVTAEDLTAQNWVVSVTEAVGLIDTPEILSIEVYPNPATGAISIESYGVNYHYVFYDMYGRILMEGFTGVEKEILNISDVSSGIYFFKLCKGNKVSVKKIVIQ